MLILTRRPNESIYIGENICIKVLSLQGKQVKLGIDVPSDVTVYREEVYQRVKEDNRLALQTSNEDLLLVTNLWEEKTK